MSKFLSGLMCAALLGASAGCSDEQAITVASLVSSAKASGKQGSANALAVSAFASQLTIYCLASALSQAASIDLQGDDLPALSAFGNSSVKLAYTLDPENGTGKVTGERDGKTVIDLAFKYERAAGNVGMAYSVTDTSGQVEGFEMFFPRLDIRYTAVTGSNFKPLKTAQGESIFNVNVEAAGSFGLGGKETMRLERTSINLTYPITQGEGKVGTFIATTRDGDRLDGELLTANKALTLRGVMKDPTGLPTYVVDAGPNGQPVLKIAEPPATPSPSPAVAS